MYIKSIACIIPTMMLLNWKYTFIVHNIMGNILVAAFLVLLAFVHTCLRTLYFICVGIILYLTHFLCLLFSSRLRITFVLAAYKHITWHCQQMIIERVYLFLGLPTTRDSFLSGFDVSFFFSPAKYNINLTPFNTPIWSH